MELLADDALGQLSVAEQRELQELLATSGMTNVPDFDRVVDAADMAMRGGEPANAEMPAEVASRLMHVADAFCAGREATKARETTSQVPPMGAAQLTYQPADDAPRRGQAQYASMTWEETGAERARRWSKFAVAALIAIAAATALFVIARPDTKNVLESRMALLGQADVVQVAWSDWAVEGAGPEIPGVTGDVVWSDSAQRGYMRFVNLPVNDPTKQQYQLWIIDKERGMSQRISGGIFDGRAGETVVEIEPRLLVNKAAAFAITIEKPGGTWVSDMTRRVNIAPVPD